MRILHTADIHLRELGDERWDTLVTLLRLGAKEKVGLFVISGDLFNEDIDAEKLRPKIREVFSNNPFRIVIIPGNHDKESFKDGKYFGENVDVILNAGSPIDTYEDVRVFGIPFEPLSSQEIIKILLSIEKTLKPDKKNILLFHGELLGQFFSQREYGDEGDERYMPVKLSYFKDLNIDYILAGHFHSGFDYWETEPDSHKYFVYSGSPIAITKREIGRRKVNIFKVGEKPNEVTVDTPHYEDVEVVLDPLTEEDPEIIITDKIGEPHSDAKTILTVKGFINSEKIGLNETELKSQIEKIFSETCNEIHYEVNDIKTIVEDDLFISFIKKLDETEHGEEKKKQLREMATRAMLEVKL
jgi:DNA repair exonuclease SbcCD nuclease subunit